MIYTNDTFRIIHITSHRITSHHITDNNLEEFIRQDLYELTLAPALQDSSLTTWVYFDGRNYLGTNEDIVEPLQNVYDATTNRPLQRKSTGSQYFTYNHNAQQMQLDTELPGEQDGDGQVAIYEFLVHALNNCVQRGSDEYFLVFSSHGSGFYGFGGDDHYEQDANGRRKLAQPNQRIVQAIETALGNVQGAPDRLDVVGFDACLMQAAGAADDYHKVTRYYLASEAVEPGHGTVISLACCLLVVCLLFLFHQSHFSMVALIILPFFSFVRRMGLQLFGYFRKCLGHGTELVCQLFGATAGLFQPTHSQDVGDY